jgi:hypothetical protein
MMFSSFFRIAATLLVLALIGGGIHPAYAVASAPAAPTAQAKTFEAVWQRTPPTVDGDLSDWEPFAKLPLNDETASYPTRSQRPRPDDLSGWASIVWTSDHVYLAVWVIDNAVVRNSRNWRLDDMAEFVFDLDGNAAFSLGDLRFTLSPDGLVTDNGGLPLGVISAIRRHERGWLGEMAVPITQFGTDFLSNAQVGFTWGLQDDDGGVALKQLVWAGTTFGTPSAGQGLLSFVNGPRREWMTFRPGVGGYHGITDATLNSWPGNENTNFGNAPVISVRGEKQWHLAIKIEPPPLPPGARVLAARLHMNLVDPPPANPNNSGTTWARAYRLLRTWDENSVTWFQARTGQRWTIGGAGGIGSDRSDVVVAETRLNPQTRSYTWELGALIADWYARPEANHGLLIRGEAGANVLYHFHSSECTANPTCAPWIELYVELPPPGN